MKLHLIFILAILSSTFTSCSFFGSELKMTPPYSAIKVKNQFNDGRSKLNRSYTFQAGTYAPVRQYGSLILYRSPQQTHVKVHEVFSSNRIGGIFFDTKNKVIKGGHLTGEVYSRGRPVDANIVKANVEFVD